MSLFYLVCSLLFSAAVSFPIGNQDVSDVKVADPTFLVNLCAGTRDHIFSRSIHCLFCKGFHYSCWHTTTPTSTPVTTASTTKNLPTVALTTIKTPSPSTTTPPTNPTFQ